MTEQQPADFLVIADRGVYSSYSVSAYRCTEMEARELRALHKDVQRIIRERRFVVPNPNPYVPEHEQVSHHFGYGAHADIRMIQRVTGKALFDDLSEGEGVGQLIEMYRTYVALALPPAARP